MRRTSVFARITALAGAMTAIAAMGAVSAQERDENQVQAQTRSELEMAREQLEIAAREVARLSAQVAGPLVGDVVRQFRVPGRRAMLGISIGDAEEGVRVDGVTPGGPAAQSGVQAGDIIVAMDGAALSGESPSQLLIAQMGNVDPGDTVSLTVVRDGDEREVQVVSSAFAPQSYSFIGRDPGRGIGGNFTLPVPPSFGFLGSTGLWGEMELAELTPGLGAYFGTAQGILVVRAPTDERLQLRDGDVILEIGGRTPNSTEHAMRIVGSFEPGEVLALTIMRDQRRQTLQIEIPRSAQRG